MSNTKNYILFQAYGNEAILAECRLALMELLQYNDPAAFSIVLYTDNAGYFEKELDAFDNKIIRPVTPQDIADWKGTINFVHRVKIKVLQDFFSNYTGNVIYCDTDTCCERSLADIFNSIALGNIYMHQNEGQIKAKTDIEARKWFRFFTSKVYTQNAFLIDPADIYMINAGVIGMNSEHAGLLPQVLEITDRIYPLFPRHTVEQFAFGYVFQKQTTVRSAESGFFHYWDLKEYRIFLQDFFAGAVDLSLSEQQKLLQRFTPQRLMKEKAAHKKAFFIKKLFTGKWNMEKDRSEMRKMINNI